MVFGEYFASVLIGAQAGADWAWDRLYAGFAPSVLGYFRLRGAADPENLLGETFFQLAKNIERYSGDETAFRSYLFTIAHGCMVDERRSAFRRRVDVTADLAVLDSVDETDPAEEAVRADSTERILAVLSRLSADQRDVLLLRMVSGFSLEETAQILSKSVGAVKALQSRGCASLRKTLDQPVSSGPAPSVTSMRWVQT